MERQTTLFENQSHVKVSEMHIVCVSGEPVLVKDGDLEQLGLVPKEWQGFMWSPIQGIEGLKYAVLFKTDDTEFRHGLHCLMEKDGTTRAFFDYRDLKAWVLEHVLQKHVLYC